MDVITKKTEVILAEEGMKTFAKTVKEASHGGRVLLFAEEGRRGEDARAALCLEGLKVTAQDPTDRIFSDCSPLWGKSIPEGCMAVAGIGGAAAVEAAKAVGLGRRFPRVLYPTELSALSAFDERCFFGTKGGYSRLETEGHTLLFDQETLASSKEIRAGLGYLLARITEEADGIYERLIEKGKSPAADLSLLKERISLLSDIKEAESGASVAKIAYALFEEKEGLTPSDGVHVFALALAKKLSGIYPDLLFPAAYAVLRLYEKYLTAFPLEHCPPPDREKGASLLKEECGFDPSDLYRGMRGYADDYRERAQKTAEYREDFAECFTQSLSLARLSRLYRRAARPEREKSPSAEELLFLLSLTGEAVSGYPLFKHIKMTGLLEPLLRAG